MFNDRAGRNSPSPVNGGIRSIIFFILFTIASGVLGYFILRPNASDNYPETTAIIESFEETWIGDEASHNTIVWYHNDEDGLDYHGLSIGGYQSSWKVGDEVKIKYNPDNHADVYDASSKLIIYIAFGIALAVGIGGLIWSIKHLKKTKERFQKMEKYEYNNDDIGVLNISSDEKMKDYFYRQEKNFSFNQIMETCDDKTLVYTAKQTKFRLFTDCDFEFYNKITGIKRQHKIGKVVSIGTSSGTSSYLTESYFKYDGVNILDKLLDDGVRIDFNGNMFAPVFDVFLKGTKIATLEVTGVKQESEGFASKLKAIGFYKISCYEDYIDLAFLCAFTITKLH